MPDINWKAAFVKGKGPLISTGSSDEEPPPARHETVRRPSAAPPPVRGTRRSLLGGDTPRAARTSTSPSSPATQPPDPRFLGELEDALGMGESSAYGNFRTHLRDLGAFISDPRKRSAAALKVARASTDELLGAIRSMLSALHTKEREFENELKGEADELEEQSRAQIATSVSRIEELDQQIEALQREREAQLQTIEGAEQNIAGVQGKVDEVRGRYQSALLALRSELEENLEALSPQHDGQ